MVFDNPTTVFETLRFAFLGSITVVWIAFRPKKFFLFEYNFQKRFNPNEKNNYGVSLSIGFSVGGSMIFSTGVAIFGFVTATAFGFIG